MNKIARLICLNFLTRYKLINSKFGSGEFSLLDVGIGNHSPSKFKGCFPKIKYSGIDKWTHYNLYPDEHSLIEKFWQIDLESFEFDPVPEEYFDVLCLSHILEHLRNGDVVLAALTRKLKKGGYVYVEFPSPRSTGFPSMKGTLNFYDDPTHVRLFDLPEISGILTKSGFIIEKSGIKRDFIMIAAIPFRVVHSLIKRRPLLAGIFWDLFGFSEYIFARKTG